MPKRTIPYSFSLSHSAAKIVNGLRSRTKSYRVSQAIVWYFTVPLSHKTSPVEVHDLLESFNEKCIRVVELEKQLAKFTGPGQVTDDEANYVPPGWGQRLRKWISCRFHI